MRYFIVENDPQFTDFPVLRDGSAKIDARYLKKGLTGKLPDRQLINIYPHEDMMFPDIMTRPFPLFSREAKALADRYQTGITYKEIILLDGVNGLTQLYYLAVLDEVDCLHESSVLNKVGTVLVRPVLNYDSIRNKCIFKLQGTYGTHIIMRLDLVESLLRRDARGLKLTLVELS